MAPNPSWLREPHIHTSPGWSDCWNSAQDNANSSFASVLFLGDSVTQGASAGNFNTQGFVQLVRAALIARGLPLGGDYYQATDSADFTSGWATPPFTVTSTARTYSFNGLQRAPQFVGAGVGTVTFVTPYACTDVDILYYSGAAGTWQYAIDGAAPVLVTNGATGANYRVTLTGLSSAVHTIVCSGQSADNVMTIFGGASYPTAASRLAGIGYGHVGTAGIGMFHSRVTGSGVSDRIRQWSGWAGNANPERGYGFPTAPSLAIIELGINDLANLSSPLGFQGGLRRLIQALRRGVSGCSILLIGALNADQTNSDVTSGRFDYSNNWHLYLHEMGKLAVSYNCAFLNVHAKWGETPVAQGFATATNSHPTAAGHADIANSLLLVV